MAKGVRGGRDALGLENFKPWGASPSAAKRDSADRVGFVSPNRGAGFRGNPRQGQPDPSNWREAWGVNTDGVDEESDGVFEEGSDGSEEEGEALNMHSYGSRGGGLSRAIGTPPPRQATPPREMDYVKADASRGGVHGHQTSESSSKILRLFRESCSALGRPAGEGDRWARKLESEWIESPDQLKALDANEWARLKIPVGLEAEIRRRISGPGRNAGAAVGAQLRRPQSAGAVARSSSATRSGAGGGNQRSFTPAARRAEQGAARSSSGAPPTPRRHLGGRRRSSAQLSTDAAGLHGLLRLVCGEGWPSHLMSALGLARRHAVDQHGLQSALRSLGVTGSSNSQIQGVIRAAASGSGGSPSAESVIATIHGPLKGPKAGAVQQVFTDLGGTAGDRVGRLSMQFLKRRCAPLELPGIKGYKISAEEGLRSLMKCWKGLDAVGMNDFLDAHILVSAMHRGDDLQFEQMVRRLWRLPPLTRGASASVTASAPAGFDHEPYLIARGKGSENLSQSLDLGGGSKPSRPAAGKASALRSEQESQPQWGISREHRRSGRVGPDASVQDHLRAALGSDGGDEEEDYRISEIEERIHQTPRAAECVARLRTALRRRGMEAFEGLATRFRLAERRGGGRVGAEELQTALREVGVGASPGDVIELLRVMDLNGNGVIDLEEWLRVLRGPMPPKRVALVTKAFEALDHDKSGYLELDELKACYQPSKDPFVDAGKKTNQQAVAEMLKCIGDSNGDGRISLAEFIRYYEKISCGIDSEQYFAHVVHTAWGLSTDASDLFARNARRMYEGNLRITEGGLCGR
eukprot:TRINITY_DN93350_c0_g1_i1.p1 TRINITY_DN93350_c0_g1~~TRINITY_DN93350_c0_g1_i1.p1  ORF type:complete len:808 (+),score=118.80 TRINITY_DN93350_c0_g1_i1:72-2495(+)